MVKIQLSVLYVVEFAWTDIDRHAELLYGFVGEPINKMNRFVPKRFGHLLETDCSNVKGQFPTGKNGRSPYFRNLPNLYISLKGSPQTLLYPLYHLLRVTSCFLAWFVETIAEGDHAGDSKMIEIQDTFFG